MTDFLPHSFALATREAYETRFEKYTLHTKNLLDDQIFPTYGWDRFCIISSQTLYVDFNIATHVSKLATVKYKVSIWPN